MLTNGSTAMVVFVEFCAEPASLLPHQGIDARIERNRPVEHLDAERVFLDLGRSAGKGRFHQMPEQAAHPLGSDEQGAFEELLQFSADRRNGDLAAFRLIPGE